jgi:hypothetical protein
MTTSISTMTVGSADVQRQLSSSAVSKRSKSSFSIEALIARDDADADRSSFSVRPTPSAIDTSSPTLVQSEVTSRMHSENDRQIPYNSPVTFGGHYPIPQRAAVAESSLALSPDCPKSPTLKAAKLSGVVAANDRQSIVASPPSKFVDFVRPPSTCSSSSDCSRRHSSSSMTSPQTNKHLARRPSFDEDLELTGAKRHRLHSGSSSSSSSSDAAAADSLMPPHTSSRCGSVSGHLSNTLDSIVASGAHQTCGRNNRIGERMSPSASSRHRQTTAVDLPNFFDAAAAAQRAFQHQSQHLQLPHQLQASCGQRPQTAAAAEAVASLLLRQHHQRELHQHMHLQQQQQQQQQFCGSPSAAGHSPQSGNGLPRHQHSGLNSQPATSSNHHQQLGPAAAAVRILGHSHSTLPHPQPSPAATAGVPMHWPSPSPLGNHLPPATCGPMLPLGAAVGGTQTNVHRGVGARDEFAPFYAWLLSRPGAYFNHRVPGGDLTKVFFFIAVRVRFETVLPIALFSEVPK